MNIFNKLVELGIANVADQILVCKNSPTNVGEFIDQDQLQELCTGCKARSWVNNGTAFVKFSNGYTICLVEEQYDIQF